MLILGVFQSGWYAAKRGDQQGYVPEKYILRIGARKQKKKKLKIISNKKIKLLKSRISKTLEANLSLRII